MLDLQSLMCQLTLKAITEWDTDTQVTCKSLGVSPQSVHELGQGAELSPNLAKVLNLWCVHEELLKISIHSCQAVERETIYT